MARTNAEGRPETLVEYAQRRIKTAIADGTIQPGARLSAPQMATEFGLSHIPVREALTSLTAAGYVMHKQGRGFFARELSSDDLADIYHWREVLEREAYTMSVHLLTDDDLQEMERLIEQMGRRTSSADRLEYLDLNREYHFVPFRRAGSRRLLRFLNFLWDSAQPYGSLELTDSTRSHEEHVSFIPIFAARDTDAVIAAMDQHRRVRTDHVEKWEAERRAGGSPVSS